jgi:hypothetical protein
VQLPLTLVGKILNKKYLTKIKKIYNMNIMEDKMDYKYLLKFVNNILKEYKFKRKSNNWYFEFDETIIVFNMQRSNFCAYYFLNIGAKIKDIDNENKFPREYQCDFRIRLNNYCLDDNDYFDLENTIIDNNRENGIKVFLEEIVIKTIKKISTVNGIKEYCKEFPKIINSQNRTVKKYLGLIDNE